MVRTDSQAAARFQRRGFLTLAGATLLGVAGCTKYTDTGKEAAADLGALPTGAPKSSTGLNIAIHETQVQLAANPKLGPLPFKVSSWPTVDGGPDVIQGFRAGSIDLADNAGMPPIQAHDIDFGAKIVAISHSTKVSYIPTTRPGSDITSVHDVRGKKIGFSQGQAQGVTILKWLAEAGLGKDDVTLVDMPSTDFLTALQGKQVDVAPLTEPKLTKYLDQYAGDGARKLDTDVQDLLGVLWAPTTVLADDDKAAAIEAFIPVWVKGTIWAYENPGIWIKDYYVKDQGVTVEDGKRILSQQDKPIYPEKWDSSIAWEQGVADLMAKNGFVKKFDVNEIFDRRFEGIASDAAPAKYRIGGEA